MNLKELLILPFLLIPVFKGCAQEILTKNEALKMLMEKNFDLKIADLNVIVAKNNTNILNSGYLPSLSANGSVAYNIDNSGIVFSNGSDTTIKRAESDSRILNLNLNYILFDGFNRKHNISRNKENLTLAQLNAQATLENTLIAFYTLYYNIAQSQQTLSSLGQTLQISKDRLTRTQYGFDYGRNTRLDVSNAEVDINTDSINYLNAYQLLQNQIRNLNILLSIESSEIYKVDTTVQFKIIEDQDAMRASMIEANTQIRLAKSGAKVSQFDNQISKRNLFPTISINSGYSTGVNNIAPGNFLSSRTNKGITYGASFTWNLFDGGKSTVAMQNARINRGIQETVTKQTTVEVQSNFENTWSEYENRLFVIKAQQNNLLSNQQNFERTKERYKLGQVTSLDFRTAQLNLLQAEINLIQAKYNAKISEITLYQLAGKIHEAEF